MRTTNFDDPFGPIPPALRGCHADAGEDDGGGGPGGGGPGGGGGSESAAPAGGAGDTAAAGGSPEPGGGDWLKAVPAEHLETAARYRTLGDLVKGNAQLREQVSKALFVPGEDASDAERAKFFERLGRPRTADGYRPPDIEGAGFDEDRQTAFFGVAHGLGLTQAQAEGLMTWEHENARAARAAADRAGAEAHRRLEDAWGADAAANYEKARRVGDILFTPAQKTALGLGDDPRTWNADFAAALSGVSPSFMDHPHLGRAERDLGKPAADLDAELDRLMAEPDYYRNERHQTRAREISEALHGTRSIHPAGA